jgi:chromosome segregation ATPase
MSNYVLNNKFKKWSSLLAQNPDNLDYKNKVSKYGTLMVRAVQGGGNGNGEVDELLRKIDGVVRKNNMNGGGKQVTGYRNMRGGGEFEDAQKHITALGAEIERQNQAYSALVEKFSTTVGQLIAKITEEKQQLQIQKAKVDEAVGQITNLRQQLTAKGESENQQLVNLQQQLATQKRTLDAKIDELTEQLRLLKVAGEEAVAKIDDESQKTQNEQNKQTLDTAVGDAAAAALEGGSRRTTRRH